MALASPEPAPAERVNGVSMRSLARLELRGTGLRKTGDAGRAEEYCAGGPGALGPFFKFAAAAALRRACMAAISSSPKPALERAAAHDGGRPM